MTIIVTGCCLRLFFSQKKIKNPCNHYFDSEGDGLNQTVWIVDKKKKIKKVSESSQCDIARAYKLTTLLLKMKPDEHEYKVMGLAPYAKINIQLMYKKKFIKIFYRLRVLKLYTN